MKLRAEVESEDTRALEEVLGPAGLSIFAREKWAGRVMAYFDHRGGADRTPITPEMLEKAGVPLVFVPDHTAFQAPGIVSIREGGVHFWIHLPQGRIHPLATEIEAHARITNIGDEDLTLVVARDHVIAASFLDADGDEMLEIDAHEEESQTLVVPPGKTLEDDVHYEIELGEAGEIRVAFGSVVESFNGEVHFFNFPPTPLLFLSSATRKISNQLEEG